MNPGDPGSTTGNVPKTGPPRPPVVPSPRPPVPRSGPPVPPASFPKAPFPAPLPPIPPQSSTNSTNSTTSTQSLPPRPPSVPAPITIPVLTSPPSMSPPVDATQHLPTPSLAVDIPPPRPDSATRPLTQAVDSMIGAPSLPYYDIAARGPRRLPIRPPEAAPLPPAPLSVCRSAFPPPRRAPEPSLPPSALHVLLAARAPGTLGRASLPQLLLPPDSGNAPQTMFPVNVKDTRTFVASAAAPATELLSTVFAQPLSSHGSLYTRAECIGAGAYGAVHLGEAHGTHYPTRRLPQPAAASASPSASPTMRDEPRPAPAPAPATAPPEMPARVPRAVALKSSQQQPGKDGFPVTMTREVLVSRAIARSVPVLDVVTRVEQGGYGGYDVQRQRAAPGVTASHTVAASTAPPLTLRRSSAPAPVADKVLALTVWPTALAACALDPPALAQGDFAGFPRLLPPRLAAGAVVWLSFPRISHDLFGLTQAHRKGARLRVPPRHVKYMLYRLLQALEECEHAAVLHRDLKGSNVLVDERGRVLLADYGLARQHQDHLAALGYTNRVVTLWYRAPELLLGSSAYDSGVDVWSAGCVFAELLSGGRPLFQGHNNDVEQLRKIISVLGAPQKREDKPRKAPWTQVWNEFHTMCSLAGPMSKAKQTLTEIFKIVSAEEQQRAYEAEISASVPAAASVKAPENAATSPSRDSGSTQPPVSTDEHISPPINLNLDDEKAGTQVSTQEEPVDVVKPVLVTEDEMEILFSMLTMDPLKRPSARQLLNHHYFADDLIDEEVYMKEFFDIFSVGEFRERMFKARF